MRIGLGLPQIGTFADPDATQTVAIAAETAGFASVWALDRALAPLAPRSPYGGMPGHELPAEQHIALDPLGVLTLASAVTNRIRVGTNVLVAPWYSPVLLARSLTTLDIISNGRLDVGLGLGWSIDEYEAVGVPKRDLGHRTEEILDVFDAIWSDGPAEVSTSRERVPASVVRPRPVQSPRPPLLFAAYTPAGLDRIARRGDGWTPAGLPVDVMAAMWSELLRLTESYGRDPSQMRLVVRANAVVTRTPLGADRYPFTGTTVQLREDIDRIAEIAAHEVIVDLQGTTSSTDELLEVATTIAAPFVADLSYGRPAELVGGGSAAAV